MVAKRALVEAQEKFDRLTGEAKDTEAALGLLRYSLDCSRADVDAELRARTAQEVKVQAIIPY